MVLANSVKTSTPNYVIADISLSDFGRKEIKIAETEVPGLMALRDKYQTDKPLAIPWTNEVFPAPIGPCNRIIDSGFNFCESFSPKFIVSFKFSTNTKVYKNHL